MSHALRKKLSVSGTQISSVAVTQVIDFAFAEHSANDVHVFGRRNGVNVLQARSGIFHAGSNKILDLASGF